MLRAMSTVKITVHRNCNAVYTEHVYVRFANTTYILIVRNKQ